jgi:hypothetical protein
MSDDTLLRALDLPCLSLVARSATRLILVTAYSIEHAINAAQIQR